ncbi:hypothetical protein K8R47_03170 [archaeon]|nr:hypothetical protein [archaeon]
MSQELFCLFTFRSLVEHLNSSLDEREEPLVLISSEDKKPRINPIWYGIKHRELVAKAKYPLIQKCENSLGIDVNRNVGHISVERGLLDTHDSYGGCYCRLHLVFKNLIKLKDGRTIPHCSVDLYQESDECSPPYLVKRKDREITGGFRSKRDLSDVLPTSWFHESIN